MFWKVPGFSQPSPVEQILDREEFTLEELLDEDDIIQECKSLNGRLVAFLRERSSVEQLIRYLVEPQDSDDPKKTYKYPFTSCEVLCCELEAVYNTLLQDHELMKLLFSLLEQPPPLSCKTAGYFGRVVGNMLLRKGQEMLEYMQQEGQQIINKLVNHVDTTSISDIIKRMVGADDHNSLLGAPAPAMAPWLAQTSLLDLLLERLGPSSSTEAQANAADVLCATAHTQPSALAARMTKPAAIATLVGHALAPGRLVLVPALDVCIALLEPRKAVMTDTFGSMTVDPVGAAEADVARKDAVAALVEHVPRLVELLVLEQSGGPTQDTPYGRLAPPLGRHRIKIVGLLSSLVHSGVPAAEQAIIQSSALPRCMHLFASYPFNNLLHHSVTSMLITASSSPSMLPHLMDDCGLLDWIVGLPQVVTPAPTPGTEALAAAKAPLRAGYLGHVTQLAGHLDAAGPGRSSNGDEGEGEGSSWGVEKYTQGHQQWRSFVKDVLAPQQELENTSGWSCGRPTTQPIPNIDSDGDDFANELDLDHMSGLHQPLYHRYGGHGNEEEDVEDDEDESDEAKASGFDMGSDRMGEDMSRMQLHQRQMGDEGEFGGMDRTWAINGSWTMYSQDEGDSLGFQDASSQRQQQQQQQHGSMGMDDDDVLLGDDDERGSPEGRTRQGASAAQASPGPAGSPKAAGAGGSDGAEETAEAAQEAEARGGDGPESPGEAAAIAGGEQRGAPGGTH